MRFIKKIYYYAVNMLSLFIYLHLIWRSKNVDVFCNNVDNDAVLIFVQSEESFSEVLYAADVMMILLILREVILLKVFLK